jgi:ribonuclease P protein component
MMEGGDSAEAVQAGSVADSAPACRRARKPFTRETRLRNSAQLRLVREKGEKMVGRLMMIRVLSPAPEQQLKTAILISRHFSTKAVVRNRARRLFREALRERFPELVACWLTVTPRQYIKGRKEQDVAAELRKLLAPWLRSPQGG